MNCYELVADRLVPGIPLHPEIEKGVRFVNVGPGLERIRCGVQLPRRENGTVWIKGDRLMNAAVKDCVEDEMYLDCNSMPFAGNIVVFDVASLRFGRSPAPGLSIWPGAEVGREDRIWCKSHKGEEDLMGMRRLVTRVEACCIAFGRNRFVADGDGGIKELVSKPTGLTLVEATPDALGEFLLFKAQKARNQPALDWAQRAMYKLAQRVRTARLWELNTQVQAIMLH